MNKKHLIPTIISTASLLLVLVAVLFGNTVTLSARSAKDLKIFNSGSLDVPGISYFETNENTDFVNNLLKENEVINDSDGDVVGTILPCLRFERVKVNGFVFGNTVDFIITAPDMGKWLMELEPREDYTVDDMYRDMVDYMPSAHTKEFPVTVEYSRKSLFDWIGNYKTDEFIDAISGGLQSAYSELYTRAMKELEENLK